MIIVTSPMGFSNPRAMSLPTPPTGFAVAAYPTYAQAQGAVEHLVRNDFAVQDVTIVGSDLQMVERVTGRLTQGKLAAAGAASGAWMGLFVGLILSIFGGRGNASGIILIPITVLIGAAFGAVMGLLGASLAKGRRDFTSASQVVARRYDVLCQPRSAEQARTLLSRMELGAHG